MIVTFIVKHKQKIKQRLSLGIITMPTRTSLIETFTVSVEKIIEKQCDCFIIKINCHKYGRD